MEGLLKTTAGELTRSKGNCFVLSDRSPIRYVMQELQQKNFLSMPLQNSEGTYVGITNLADIMCFVVGFVLGKAAGEPPQEIDSVALERLDWDVSNCLGLSPESAQLWEFPLETPLSKILEVFHKGIHRVLVSSEDHKTVKILTQTDVLNLLYNNLSSLKSIADQPLISGEHPELTSFKETGQAYHAFTRMMVHGIRGLPIVNNEGKLVASLFQTDLRGLEPTDVKKLLLPVSEFVKTLPKAKTPVTCRENVTVGEALELLAKNKVLAIWVIDGNNKPIRSISASDVIQKFSPL